MPATSRKRSNLGATCAWTVLAVFAAVAHAAAQPSSRVIAAFVPEPNGRDARLAVAVGPGGEVYEPDGQGRWVRHRSGGIADEVVAVSRGPGSELALIAVTRKGMAFAWYRGAWSRIYLGKRAPVVLGSGSPAVVAMGAEAFAFTGDATSKPVALPKAKRPIVAVGASSLQRMTIATSQELQRLAGTTWKSVAKLPRQVDALLSDRWAVTASGLWAIDSRTSVAWPTGFRVARAIAVSRDFVVAAGDNGTRGEVVIFRAGKLTREAITPLMVANLQPPSGATDSQPPSPAAQSVPPASPELTFSVAGVAADTSGRVVVAMLDGKLAIRDRSGWTTTAVYTERAPAHAGSPPAMSRP